MNDYESDPYMDGFDRGYALARSQFETFPVRPDWRVFVGESIFPVYEGTAIAALRLARNLQRNGCRNVRIESNDD